MKNVPGFWAFLLCVAGACGGKSISDDGSPGNAGGAASSGGSAALGGSPGSAGSPIGIGGVSFAGSANIAGASGSSALDAGGNCQDEGRDCLRSPADAACVTDADCEIGQVPSCGDIPLVGLNKRGNFVCPALPCVPSGYDFIVYRTQDCQSVTTPDFARVRCVENRCLTYRSGCSECPK